MEKYMTLPCAEKVLKSALTKNIRTKYTVSLFCREAKIDRGTFYNHYRNLSDLFLSVLTLQMKRALKCQNSEHLNSIFYRLLKVIAENKFFYFNIISLANDPYTFYAVLRKELAFAIEEYLRPRTAFSVRKVELISNAIYTVINHWVKGFCQQDIRDVYQTIGLLLVNLEEPEKL
ncbi:TetR-like C-terminal domain-containing protein [Lactobacillus sp. ESL0684]|uniref:TetR/AcrR family transcriptional regulator n=1 Tax=Lactobacillus sp. ESL0684 TaxID=2983213 RepID=UPI0023F72683|nr:TetR-like C-terminal domain-containing protein [Lactobacillus sp. ESL0684]WEV43188.1 TetR-like C-terminal domain-containing protein [Lactobacillus sp. ESL0684]